MNFTPKQEGTISIIAALLVLFSAMIDPLYSVGLAVAVLLILGYLKFVKK